jgi:hypothetical protein
MNIRCIISCAALLWSAVSWAQPDLAAQPIDLSTLSGRVYHRAVVVRADPDGLLVSYRPTPGGMGLAKVRFLNLPESTRNQYGYNPQSAAQYELAQAKAAEQWRSEQIAANSLQHFRAVADMARFLGGTDYSTFWVNLDPDGRVTANGFSGNVPPYVWEYSPNAAVVGRLAK